MSSGWTEHAARWTVWRARRSPAATGSNTAGASITWS